MTEDVGWVTRTGGGFGAGNPVKINVYNSGTKEVLQAISKNPEASLELLQNPVFVRNAMKMENSGENEDTISQIIRSGMSGQIQENNLDKRENALRNIVEALRDPQAIRGTSKSGLHESENIISERTAKTLAELYQNNIEIFSAGTGRSQNRTNDIDIADTRIFLKAIKPYGAVKDENGITLDDKIVSATAVKYTELLMKAESTGDVSYAQRAADLRATYIDAKNQSNPEDAKEAEARREQLGKAIGIAAELGVFYGGKNQSPMK